MQLEQRTWLAGLLEGEGYFGWGNNSNGRYGSPLLKLGMTDEDVVEKAKFLMGIKSKTIIYPGNEKKKTLYVVQCSGTKAVEIINAILPYMGTRRQTVMLGLIEKFEKRPSYSVNHLNWRGKENASTN